MSFLTEIVRTIGKGKVVVSGSFVPNTSSTLDATKVYGKGFSVAYTSTGVYTFTFDKPWNVLQSALASLQLASPAAAHDLVWGVYTASSKTITLSHYSGGSLADIASDANNRIHFAFHFKNTNAPG